MNIAMAAHSNHNPLHVRHDVMVEIGRIDLAFDRVADHPGVIAPDKLQQLDQRRAQLCQYLARLPA